MKKILFVLSLFISILAFSQSKYTADQVEKSTDPKVIANFIKYNPDHPKTPFFKQKLYSLIMDGNSKIAKPTVAPITPEKLKTEVKKEEARKPNDPHTQKTVDLLNHMFNNDPTRPDAYIQIVNQSKCNMIVKISGKKFFNLDVKANDQNFIIVPKGTYTLTTNVCDAKYSSVKNVNRDIAITLSR